VWALGADASGKGDAYFCGAKSSLNHFVMQNPVAYQPKNKVRLVTAASLFDGHDAAINIMRRIMQSSGAEIIHLDF